MILVTCIFFFFLIYKEWKSSSLFCPLSRYTSSSRYNCHMKIPHQATLHHARVPLSYTSSTHSCSMHSTFFPISGQPSFLFKRYIEISLRSGSRTTLYLLQWRWLPRRVAVIDGRSRCTASKRVIGSLSPFSLSLSFSLVVSLSLSFEKRDNERDFYSVRRFSLRTK